MEVITEDPGHFTVKLQHNRISPPLLKELDAAMRSRIRETPGFTPMHRETLTALSADPISASLQRAQLLPPDEPLTLSAEEDWNWTTDYEESPSVPSPAKRWTFETGRRVISTPAVVDGVVIVGSNDQKVHALSIVDGSKLWDFKTQGSVNSSPAVADGVVFFGSEDHKVYALRAADGTKLWEFETKGAVYSSCCVGVDGVVYVGSEDTKLYALSAADGAQLWEFATGRYFDSRPAVVDGVVYFGSNDKKVYALSAPRGAFKDTSE